MNLYLLERQDCGGYDTYDSVVVQAESVEKAIVIHPSGVGFDEGLDIDYPEWVKPEDVKVTFLGTATSSLNLDEVICASVTVV